MTESFAGPDDLDADQQDALQELLFRLADDEFVLAERYVEWQIYAPTLESDLALANIAQDEFGHARLWYDLVQELGRSEAECIWEKPAAEWRHSTLAELPFEDGDWADVAVRSYLYDVAERLRVEALTESSYAPIVDRVGKIIDEERYHREHAQNWLDRLARGGGVEGGTAESHRKVQAAVDRLFPRALTLFDPGPNEQKIVEAGFRTQSLDDLRARWLDEVVPFLESIDLTVPDPETADRPAETGRDGNHTDDWPELLDEFTRTYDEFDFGEPVRLRGEEPEGASL